MVRVLVHLELDNYLEWRSTFDNNESYRKKEGSKGCEVFQNSVNPNEVFIIWNWDNIDNAKNYFGRTSWLDLMRISGLSKEPEILFFDHIEKSEA